jgi:hypothetical protein
MALKSFKEFFLANKKKLLFGSLITSFFVGIWHGFPMTTIVADEFFGSAVLRALEKFTILPQGIDVFYGTINYLACYFLIVLVLAFIFPFLGFNILNLKIFIANNIYLIYLMPRIFSAILAVILLFLVYKIFRSSVKNENSRLILLVFLFSNILITYVFHTSRAWGLTIVLAVFSFYYLYRSLECDSQNDENGFLHNSFASIIFSFLAFSNFPLAGIFLINFPVLAYFARGNKKIIKKLFVYFLAGTLLFVLITAFNFQGIKNEVVDVIFFGYTVGNDAVGANLSVLASLLAYFKNIFVFYPFHVLLLSYLIITRTKIENKKLFFLSIAYSIVYFLAISIVARWATDISSSARYLSPLVFFVTFMIASFDLKFNRYIGFLVLASVIYWITFLYYISVPTTYNLAYDWIVSNLNNADTIIFKNTCPDFDLSKNKESYLLTDPRYCSSKCEMELSGVLKSGFLPIVIDQQTKKDQVLPSADNVYSVEFFKKENNENSILVKSFINSPSDELFYKMDGMGNYFDKNYFKLGELGRNLYIYKNTSVQAGK